MPNYPSNFSNDTPWGRGPVNNVNLLYEVRNSLLRHNLITVDRIITTNVGVVAGYSGPGNLPSQIVLGDSTTVQGQGVGFVNLGLSNLQTVILAGQTDSKQNGVYIFSSGSVLLGAAGQNGLTGSTGPSLMRVSALNQAGGATRSTDTAQANLYLNNLWYHTGPVFGFTGSLSTGPAGKQMYLDEAGVAYPQGFIANSGSTADASGSSNQNKIIYYTQENWISVGSTGIEFSNPQATTALLPSSFMTAGTSRLKYSTSTVEDFFVTGRAIAELLDLINEFRDGRGTDLSAVKSDYLANMSSGKIAYMQGVMESLAPQVYEFYQFLFDLVNNYNSTTGSRYPSDFNNGYNVFRI